MQFSTINMTIQSSPKRLHHENRIDIFGGEGEKGK